MKTLSGRFPRILPVLLAVLSPLAAQTYDFTTFAGAANVSGTADGPGPQARFTSPYSPTIDRDGNLYVLDDKSIRKITPAGVVSTLVTDLSLPMSLLADDAGNLFVTRLYNGAISKRAPDGMFSTFVGNPSGPGDADGQGTAAGFTNPLALTFDSTGNLFVTDTAGTRLRRITPDGTVTTIAGARFAPGSVDGPGSAARFTGAYSLASDRAGGLFISDSPATLRKIDATGRVTTLAGVAGQSGSSDGVGAAARFNNLGGIVVTAAGTVLLTDSGNATIRAFTPDGAVTTIAGKVGGRATVDGLGGNARFMYPGGMVIDATGNLFVVDNDAMVIRKGTPSSALAPPIIHTPAPDAATLTCNVGAGGSFTLVAGASGGAPLAFQWTKNGAPIPGATRVTLTVPAASVADEGSYVFAATNAAGTAVSSAFTVRVYTPTLSTFTTRRVQAGGNFLWGIASGAGQLVAVGSGGTILSSPDGRTWTARDSGTTDWIVGVSYAAGKFVAVGDHGLILVSSDGAKWTRPSASGTTFRLNNVTWGAGIFVAVGEGGTVVTSPDAQTWTARPSGVGTWLRGLVYKSYVPLPFTAPTPAANVFYGTYGDNGSAMFYASGEQGVLLTSRDGLAWRPIANQVYYTNQPVVLTKDIETLADGPMGVGQDGFIINQKVSYGRVQISGKTPSFPGGLTGVTITDIVSLTWDVTSVGLAARFRGLVRGAGAIFATGENGAVAAAADYTGPWSFIPTGTTANLVNGVFHGNSLFVVGENETILQSEPLYNSRLINVATRGPVTPDSPLISGFVISGPTSKRILLRAAGPALANFGFGDSLRLSPTLTLFDAAGHALAMNSGWSTAPNAAAIGATAVGVGAFPFAVGSADSALLVTLPPGAYTAQVTTLDGATALALVEVYDADSLATEGSRAINLSTRGTVGTGVNYLVAGFVINGPASRRVLIRGVGPSLASFGLSGVLADPQLRLFDPSGRVLQTAGAWSQQSNADELRAAALMSGAFSLNEGSKDAAIVTTLLPGAYTVDVAGLGSATGMAIVEIYDLP